VLRWKEGIGIAAGVDRAAFYRAGWICCPLAIAVVGTSDRLRITSRRKGDVWASTPFGIDLTQYAYMFSTKHSRAIATTATLTQDLLFLPQPYRICTNCAGGVVDIAEACMDTRSAGTTHACLSTVTFLDTGRICRQMSGEDKRSCLRDLGEGKWPTSAFEAQSFLRFGRRM
jgi:hypothetical protein